MLQNMFNLSPIINDYNISIGAVLPLYLKAFWCKREEKDHL